LTGWAGAAGACAIEDALGKLVALMTRVGGDGFEDDKVVWWNGCLLTW